MNKLNVLAIGLDYLMLLNDEVRGDVRERQFEYAKMLDDFSLVIYTPQKLAIKDQTWSDNLHIYPTNSMSKPAFIFDAYKIASRLCKEKKFDLITTEDPFSTGLVGCLLKNKYGTPLNVQVHCNFCNNKYWIRNRRINWLLDKIAKFVLKRADSIRVGTSLDKKNISRLGIAQNKINVIPVHMDLAKFSHGKGEKIRTKLLGNEFSRLLTFVGRLSKEKDLVTMLKCIRIVTKQKKDILLAIIGSGREETKLKALTKKLGIEKNVRFLGKIPHEIVPDYLAASDIFLISSLFEGTCIAMAEAIAAGKPVVTTMVAGAEDLIINGKNGYLVKQKDCQQMAEKIIEVLQKYHDFSSLEQFNRDLLSSNFSYEKNIQNLVKIWETTGQKKCGY